MPLRNGEHSVTFIYLHGGFTKRIKNYIELGFAFLISHKIYSLHLMLFLKEL